MADYIDPTDLPDGEHLALLRRPDGTEVLRFVNRSGWCLASTASHAIKWEQSSARIVALLHRADECPGGGWEPAEFGPELAGQTVRVETTGGAIEGMAKWGDGFVGVDLGEDFDYLWFQQDMAARVFTRPDPHADLIEQLRDLLGSLPEPEMERVILAAKAAKPGGAS